MNAAALVGTASAIVIAVMGAAWMISGRVSRLESKVEDLPERMKGKMVDIVRQEQDRCPARREHERWSEPSSVANQGVIR